MITGYIPKKRSIVSLEPEFSAKEKIFNAARATYLNKFDKFVRSSQSIASNFSARSRGRAGHLSSRFGPNDMGEDISFLRDRALTASYRVPQVAQAIRALTSWTMMSGVNIIVNCENKKDQEKVSKYVKKYFYESDECLTNRSGNIVELEKLAMSYYFRAGEVLVKARAREFDDDLTVPLSFEVIDPVQFYDGSRPNGVKVNNIYAAGIEFKPSGEPEAYWLYKGNPRDTLFDRTPVRVPVYDKSGKRQIVHLFETLFPGQIRGIPRASLVVKLIYELADYRQATLDRKRQESKLGMILKESHGSEGTPTLPGMVGEGVETVEGGDPPFVPTYDSPQFLDWLSECMMENNSILSLPPGWEADQFQISQVSDYEPFVKEVLQSCSTGFGIPYMIMTGDIEKTSFSGAKVGLLDFKNQRKKDQDYFHVKLHRFMTDVFIEAGIRAGEWTNRYEKSFKFKYDAFPTAEPEKEARTIESRLRTITISPQKACALWGEDFYEIVDEIAKADEYLVSKGLGHLDSRYIAQALGRLKLDQLNSENSSEEE